MSMCPICNINGCFSASRLLHGSRFAGEEASGIPDVLGLAKHVSSLASTSAFKKACAPFTGVLSPFFLFSSGLESDAGGAGFEAFCLLHPHIGKPLSRMPRNSAK